MDGCLVLAVALGWLVGQQAGDSSSAGLAICAAATFYFPGYPAFLALKRRFYGEESRSYLLDTLLFLLPCFFLLCYVTGQRLDLAAEFLGLALPAMCGLIRLGCFTGGCCFGGPSRLGVRYDPRLLTKRSKSWRRFTPGDDPGTRVFPIQLVDSAVNWGLFALLSSAALSGRWSPDTLLPRYLVLYGAFRFGAEFFRGERSHRAYGLLSRTQWLSLMIVTVCSALLVA